MLEDDEDESNERVHQYFRETTQVDHTVTGPPFAAEEKEDGEAKDEGQSASGQVGVVSEKPETLSSSQ